MVVLLLKASVYLEVYHTIQRIRVLLVSYIRHVCLWNAAGLLALPSVFPVSQCASDPAKSVMRRRTIKTSGTDVRPGLRIRSPVMPDPQLTPW